MKLNTHRPLSQRENPLSCDVADAIEQLIDGDLPVAFDRMDVAQQLIVIAHTDEEGLFSEPVPIARRCMLDTFYNRLTNTTVFQAGYKLFEQRSGYPVVPITDFFFKVYSDGEVAGCLDAMTPYEITQSLPKRPGIARDKDGNALMDGDDAVHSGQIAGIIVYPRDCNDVLLASWLQRRANGAAGSLDGALQALENALPDSKKVADLRAAAVPMQAALRKALPAPAKRK